MYDTPVTIEQALALLEEAPLRITALTDGLSPAQLRTAPGPGEWSANDVLAHLRSCSDMWGSYIRTIIAEDRPTFRAVNPTTWIKQTDYPDLEFHPSFRLYSAQRADLLAVLKALPPEGWSRSATVMGAGKPRQRTVLTYAQWLANHERSHFRQITNVANTVRVQQ